VGVVELFLHQCMIECGDGKVGNCSDESRNAPMVIQLTGRDDTPVDLVLQHPSRCDG